MTKLKTKQNKSMTKLKNSIYENLKTQIEEKKLKISKCDKTQRLRVLENLKFQIVKNSNSSCVKTKKNNGD